MQTFPITKDNRAVYSGENNLHQVRSLDTILSCSRRLTGVLLQDADGDILSWSANTQELNITAKASDNVVMFYIYTKGAY